MKKAGVVGHSPCCFLLAQNSLEGEEVVEVEVTLTLTLTKQTQSTES
jgi:hypothetical protein